MDKLKFLRLQSINHNNCRLGFQRGVLMTIGYELLFNGARINRMNFNEQKF